MKELLVETHKLALHYLYVLNEFASMQINWVKSYVTESHRKHCCITVSNHFIGEHSRPLTTNSASELDVLWHDRNTVCMHCNEVGVFE
jgi:hypothetical protein